jgi:hypothetical protein
MRRRTYQVDKLNAVLGDLDSDSLLEPMLRLLASHEELKSCVFSDLIRSGPPGQGLALKIKRLLRALHQFDADEARFPRYLGPFSRDS